MTHPHRIAAVAGAGVLLAGAGLAAALSFGSSSTGAKPHPAAATVERTSPNTVTAPQPAIVARAIRPVSVYRRPGAGRPFIRVGKTNGFGQPRVFLVAERRPGWERVYLPMRPDGVTGWVRDSSVSLASDPYRVVVSLDRHRIWVYDGRRRLMATKAGVGRSITATPRGTYFLFTLLKQPDPNGVYGPYAFGTSAFSNVLYHFGGGPGEIGLHGTDDPAALGTNVSHGCIRVSNAVITRLAKLLPLGTPVVIEK